MANALYDKGRQAFLEGGIAWLTDNIKAVLVAGTSYTPNLTTHQYLSDIAGGARLSTSTNLASKTSTSGIFDAADVTFTAVAGGATGTYVAIYKDSGSAATSPLIGLIDTATNLPVSTNGGDINVSWDNGTNKIGKL